MKYSKHRVFGLDVIRAIAILLVMSSHTVLLVAPESKHPLAFGIKFLGTIGVDIFFVLSGFLIGSILLKQINQQRTGVRDFSYFWIRRWFRTLPNYYLILLINVLLYYNSLNDISIWKYVFFLQNFSDAQPDFFTESWSLTIEEYSYILIPVLLLLVGCCFKRVTVRAFLFISIGVIVTIFLNRLYFHFYVDELLSWSKSLRKVLLFRLDSIYIGFVGAYIYRVKENMLKEAKYILFAIGISLFLGLHGYIFIQHIEPNVNSILFNVFYLPMVSMSILLMFPFLIMLKAQISIKIIITKISKWSYALYLVNYSIVLLQMNKHLSAMDNDVIKVVLFWFFSFILAIFLYNFYEIPLTNLRDREKFKNLNNTLK